MLLLSLDGSWIGTHLASLQPNDASLVPWNDDSCLHLAAPHRPYFTTTQAQLMPRNPSMHFLKKKLDNKKENPSGPIT